MKKYLIPNTGKFYKANLHSHTTCSDGKLTPEIAKAEYMKRGYSIVAFTDHEAFVTHNDLKDENFLPLNGFEFTIEEIEKPFWRAKSTHIGFIALRDDIELHPLWDRNISACLSNCVHLVKFDESKPDYKKVPTAEGINEAMKIGREAGFFVTYNHPTWSRNGYEEYIQFEHMNAMEIYNHCSVVGGYDEDNCPQVYADFLNKGKRIFCTATDDNHNKTNEFESAWCDSFGGYTMIKADSLNYNAVGKALEQGHFYCSNGGPEIYEVFVDDEDQTINFTFSNAVKVVGQTKNRAHWTVYPAKNYDFPLFGGEYPVDKNDRDYLTKIKIPLVLEREYIRLTLHGENGKVTYTNAYFIDEIFEKYFNKK